MDTKYTTNRTHRKACVAWHRAGEMLEKWSKSKFFQKKRQGYIVALEDLVGGDAAVAGAVRLVIPPAGLVDVVREGGVHRPRVEPDVEGVAARGPVGLA